MDETMLENLDSPRIETGQPRLIAGIGARYNGETSAGIPAQWQRFVPQLGHVPGQVDGRSYGVCHNSDDCGNFDYICGVEVADYSDIPKDWSRVSIPEHLYAVFPHKEHISMIRRTWNTILNKWLPESEYEMADGPDFELYEEEFDGTTGSGGVEIWIPVKRR